MNLLYCFNLALSNVQPKILIKITLTRSLQMTGHPKTMPTMML
jgi:hypothetical protein